MRRISNYSFKASPENTDLLRVLREASEAGVELLRVEQASSVLWYISRSLGAKAADLGIEFMVGTGEGIHPVYFLLCRVKPGEPEKVRVKTQLLDPRALLALIERREAAKVTTYVQGFARGKNKP